MEIYNFNPSWFFTFSWSERGERFVSNRQMVKILGNGSWRSMVFYYFGLPWQSLTINCSWVQMRLFHDIGVFEFLTFFLSGGQQFAILRPNFWSGLWSQNIDLMFSPNAFHFLSICSSTLLYSAVQAVHGPPRLWVIGKDLRLSNDLKSW